MVSRLFLSAVITLIITASCAGEYELTFIHPNSAIGMTAIQEKEDTEEIGRRYSLEYPVIVTESDLALSLTVSTTEPKVIVVLLNGNEVLAAHALYVPDDIVTADFRIPLARETRFDGFVVRGAVPGRTIDLVSAGLVDSFSGISFTEIPTINSRMLVKSDRGNPHSTHTLLFPMLLLDVIPDNGVAYIQLTYTYSSDYEKDVYESESRVTITAARHDSERREMFSLTPRPGKRSVYLYEALCGFLPNEITVDSHDPSFKLESLQIGSVPFFTAADEVYQPLPADMGAIISYDKSLWRRSEYELFAWNLDTEILLIDTIDYKFQSLMFKRLAFFVEKLGSAGTILSNKALEGAHGWNAHDYQSIDLARFFNEARRIAFKLNDEERLLLEILKHNGIILENEGEFQPGVGGILSISQASTPRLRRIFINHEGYHGVFFGNAEFRDHVFEIWLQLSTIEQDFWKKFLAWKYYNSEDTYLVVNEFQSYLLQQHLDRVDPYFIGYAIPNMAAELPKYRDIFSRLVEEYPTSFVEAAKKVDRAAYLSAGVHGEDLLCLKRVSE
jgi:hypothetical protein